MTEMAFTDRMTPPTLREILVIPEDVTAVFQKIWNARGKRADMTIIVTPCDRSQEELAALSQAGRRIGYLPDGLSGQYQRYLFKKIFPKIKYAHGIGQVNTVTNDPPARSGWFDYESDVSAPYGDTTEDELKEKIAATGKLPMNLNEYVVASQDSLYFIKHYLDPIDSHTRLLGSHDEARVVIANFSRNGQLYVDPGFLSPISQNPWTGGRSVGIKFPFHP